MKKSYIVIILLIIVIIAMTIPYLDNELSQEEVWLLSDADNSFRLEFQVLIFQFADILEYATKAESAEDIAYVRGRIESCLQAANSQITRLSSHANIDQERMGKVIDPTIQEPIFDLISNIRGLLSNLNERVLQKEDNVKLMEVRAQLSSLYLLARELNNGSSNRFTNKEEVKQQKFLIDNLNNKIKNVSF
jgi:hypothetical protein